MDQYQSSSLLEILECLYEKANRREMVYPDPLTFVLSAGNPFERECVGLIASSLAYGRLTQIYRSLSGLFARIGSIGQFLTLGNRDIQRTLDGFRHRFCTGSDIAQLIFAIRRVREEYGSLKLCFLDGYHESHDTYFNALSAFAAALRSRMSIDLSPGVRHLLPDPQKGSALKRLNLFLRWMIRNDNVDPGVWSELSPDQLIVPVDVHMYRFGRALGYTIRRQMDMRAALEITGGFKRINPKDPVKYDFALARLGMEGRSGSDWLNRFAA